MNNYTTAQVTYKTADQLHNYGKVTNNINGPLLQDKVKKKKNEAMTQDDNYTLYFFFYSFRAPPAAALGNPPQVQPQAGSLAPPTTNAKHRIVLKVTKKKKNKIRYLFDQLLTFAFAETGVIRHRHTLVENHVERQAISLSFVFT